MSPRARQRRKPEVVEDQLDDLEDDPTPVEPSLEIVPNVDNTDIDNTDEDMSVDEDEQMLNLIRRELGVILDSTSLEMCLAVSDFYRSARRIVEADRPSNSVTESDIELDGRDEDDELDDL